MISPEQKVCWTLDSGNISVVVYQKICEKRSSSKSHLQCLSRFRFGARNYKHSILVSRDNTKADLCDTQCVYHHRVSQGIRREVPGTQDSAPLSLLPGFLVQQNLISFLSMHHWDVPSFTYLEFWIEAPVSELFTVHMILTITTNPKLLHCTLDQLIRTLFLEFSKMPSSFVLHVDRFTNVRKGVLLKYRSFIKFWEPPILQGRIHGAKIP